MEFSQIKDSLRKMNEVAGYNAAMVGWDRGLCPHMTEPDKSDWERGWDMAKSKFSYNLDDYYYD